MRISGVIGFVLITGLAAHAQPLQDYTRFVDPFIGTDGTGHAFPGATVPFGVVQPSPDNRNIGWDYTSGYQYQDTTLLGFSNIHFSGTGISEGGNVLLLPFIDTLPALQTSYQKSSEKAEPGYYSVRLKQGVSVELTATEHVAFHQYTYPSTGGTKVYLDLQHGLRFLDKPLILESEIHQPDSCTLTGYLHTDNWVKRKLFFCIKFNHPIVKKVELQKEKNDKAPKYVLSFSKLTDRQLKVKVTISTVSEEGAIANQIQLKGWDFGTTKAQASSAWSSYLGRFNFSAPDSTMRMLYTSLYHLGIQPNNIADLDGRYRGADDSIRSSTSTDKRFYSTFSIWDAYRAAFPLYSLAAPDRVAGMVESLLAQGRVQGFLPVYSICGKENYCMIGNHSIPMIASAYARGYTGVSPKDALALMKKSTTENHLNSDWLVLNRFGYYPYDKVETESVSRTAEAGVDDAAIAWLASQLKDTATAKNYTNRSNYYQNLMDPQTHLLRGRDSLGKWRTPFEPLRPTSPMKNPGDYTEANAWQYTWTPAQHNVQGLIKALGGKTSFEQKLTDFFTLKTPNPDKHLGQEALIGQYAHGNEVSHHVAFLFSYTNHPERGYEIIRRIFRDFYKPKPNGLIGNEDCGAMSAWYLYAALGFYPVNPFDGTYVLTEPQVEKTIIDLPNGNQTLTIKRKGLGSKHTWFRNGSKIESITIPHSLILEGGNWVWGINP